VRSEKQQQTSLDGMTKQSLGKACHAINKIKKHEVNTRIKQ
jgi:hypothetical protein